MSFKTLCLMSLCAMVLMTGCAAKQKFQQVGGTGVSWTNFEIEFMRDTPKVLPNQCPISMVKEYRHLEDQTWPWYRADKWFSKDKPSQFFLACPDPNMDARSQIHLESWQPIGVTWQDAPFRVVGPGLMNMAGYVAGAGTLGAVMPRATTNVSQNVVQSVPVSASTAYTNAVTVPPWIGKQ